MVDDDPDTCQLLAASLVARDYEVETVFDAQRALALLPQAEFDLVITDVNMAQLSGIELCERIHAGYPDIPVIVMTGQSSLSVAVSALRAGAEDFVTKPIDLEHLEHRLAKALRRVDLEVEVRRLHRRLGEARGSSIVGRSPAIQRVLALIERIADSDAAVLISGESGVGKELVARELHSQSGRSEGPFIAVNCAAVPANLLESELFGHVRGAFTDARRARDGLFLQASGGTLFLDELGELPLEMQPKLLRALQERKLRPVGGDSLVAFDARIVTATNRDLESEVEAGTFREDLFYRVNVVNVHVPPLRARSTDVLLLAQFFLERIAERSGRSVLRIGAPAADKLLAYDWPGNVRELENCMERAVALARYDEITAEDLPDKISRYERGEMVIAADDPEDLPTLSQLESRYIRRVLQAVKGNKTQAAKVLGLARRTLYRKLERLEAGDEASSNSTPHAEPEP